jgi:hypothetical protein
MSLRLSQSCGQSGAAKAALNKNHRPDGPDF